MKNVKRSPGDWDDIKGRLKDKFTQLTYSDLLYVDGREEEMLERLQVKLGKTKEEILQLLSENK